MISCHNQQNPSLLTQRRSFLILFKLTIVQNNNSEATRFSINFYVCSTACAPKCIDTRILIIIYVAWQSHSIFMISLQTFSNHPHCPPLRGLSWANNYNWHVRASFTFLQLAPELLARKSLSLLFVHFDFLGNEFSFSRSPYNNRWCVNKTQSLDPGGWGHVISATCPWRCEWPFNLFGQCWFCCCYRICSLYGFIRTQMPGGDFQHRLVVFVCVLMVLIALNLLSVMSNWW